jgi:hypothetical protein
MPELRVGLAAVEPLLNEPDTSIEFGVGQACVERRNALLRRSRRCAGEGDEDNENRSN